MGFFILSDGYICHYMAAIFAAIFSAIEWQPYWPLNGNMANFQKTIWPHIHYMGIWIHNMEWISNPG